MLLSRWWLSTKALYGGDEGFVLCCLYVWNGFDLSVKQN